MKNFSRSFLMALIAALVLISAKPVDALVEDPCDIAPQWHFAGDHGIIKLPDDIDLKRYFRVEEVLTEGQDPRVLLAKNWFMCHPNFELDATKWSIMIQLSPNSLFGTKVVLIERKEVGHSRGNVFACRNILHCLQTAAGEIPQAFIRPQPNRQ